MDQHAFRQLWGLTARCERAIRAMVPHWRAQASSWGEAAVLFERLFFPASWLCQMQQSFEGVPFPPAELRLMASCVMTTAKAAQLTEISPSDWFVRFAGTLPAVNKATATAVATLLLLRIGAATAALPEGPTKFLASAVVLDSWIHLAEGADPEGLCQQPSSCAISSPGLRILSSWHVSTLAHQLFAQLTGHSPISAHLHGVVHLAIGSLSDFGRIMVSEEQWILDSEASCNRRGVVATSSLAAGPSFQEEPTDLPRPSSGEELLNMPAPTSRVELWRWAVPSLLGSPLLDFLVRIQHAIVKARPSALGWSAPEVSILPVSLMPSSMDADAFGSEVAMQVGDCGGTPGDLVIETRVHVHARGQIGIRRGCGWIVSQSHGSHGSHGSQIRLPTSSICL